MHAEHADNSELNELSGRVIDCAFTVLNTLGAGFLEKVYENALAYEVRAAGLSAVHMAYKARHVICVFCVNRLSASALKIRSWPAKSQGWSCGPRL